MFRFMLESFVPQKEVRLWSVAFLGLLVPRQCDFPPIEHGASGGSATAGASAMWGGSSSIGGNSANGGQSASGGSDAGAVYATGGASSSGGASNDAGAVYATGGASSSGGASNDAGVAVIDPVLGCSAPEWPEHAEFHILPFRDPGPLPPSISAMGYSYVSADGSTAVGSSVIRRADGTYRDGTPTIWREGQAPVVLESESHYGRVNCDGSIVLLETKWWTNDGVVHQLQGGYAYYISDDGNYFVGSDTSKVEVLRWGPDRSPQHIGNPEMLAFATTVDGQTIYGPSSRPCDYAYECQRQTVRWTAATGMQFLYPWADYLAASSDGSTVASRAVSSQGDIILWTEATGPIQLACSPVSCEPRALSSRGHALLVTVNSIPSIWSEKHGFRSLAEVLTQFGASLDGYELYFGSDMSDDGRVIVGSATMPGVEGFRQFRAVLPRAAWE